MTTVSEDGRLDLTALTDAELQAVLRAVTEELSRRDVCRALTPEERTLVVTQAAGLESAKLRNEEARLLAQKAAEKVRADAERAEREAVAEKERVFWAARKGIALALNAAFEAAGYEHAQGRTVQVWMSERKEKRVYVNTSKRGEIACLYVTGNAYQAPGTITGQREVRAALLPLLQAVAARWNSIKVDVDQAAAWQGEATSVPGYVPTPAPTVTP
jgi:hypothetical protein